MDLRKAIIASAAGTAFIAIAAAPAAAKWVGPVVELPGGGAAQATIYYGPWQCRQIWLNDCQARCGKEGRRSMGCIWLADLRTDVHTRFLMMPLYTSGKRAIVHCCCDWPVVSPTNELRDRWKASRASFRERWAQEYGAWPTDGDTSWDGHHIRDLARGGNPTSPDNVFPTPRDVHEEYGRVYKACYAGGGKWAQSGPERPYAD